jgi:uncharacterized membrane protein YfcA
MDHLPQRRGTLSLRADKLGIAASVLCFVHCIATPIVLSFASVWAHYIPSEERFHRTLAVLVATIGGFAILSGYSRHRRKRVLLLMASGLCCIFAGAWWGNSLPSHLVEVLVTLMGSCLMISAHLINHTFCRHCDCAEQ